MVKISLSPRPDMLMMIASSGLRLRGLLEGLDKGVRGFEGRDDALQAHGQVEGGDDLGVGGGLEAHPFFIGEIGEDGADPDVVEAGRHRVGLEHLAVAVLQEHRLVALGHAGRGVGAAEPDGVPAAGDAFAAGLHPDQVHRIAHESLKDAHGVGTAADAGVDPGRQFAVLLDDLPCRLLADDRLEPADHFGKGGGAAGRAEDVVGVVEIGDPVAEGLVDRVLQGAGAVLDRHHGGPHLLHPEDVRALPSDIHLAHVNRAGETEFGGHGGGGHAVLAGAGLGDHPFLAHSLHQQALAHDVIGLVGAGMVEVLALDVDLRPAEMAGEVCGVGQRGRPAGVIRHQGDIFLPEGRIFPGLCIFLLQFAEGLIEHLRDIGAAPVAEKSFFVHSFLHR